MSFRTDDLQASGFPRIIIQLNICTAARHISSNSHRSVYTCISYNFRLLLMILGIEHIMFDSFSLEHSAKELRHFDGNRTYEHRLAFCIMNQGVASLRAAQAFQDRLCELLCR